MNSYFLVILADILLAATFVFQKKYQLKMGTSFKAGLVYNLMMGLFSSVIFLFVNKFHIEFSWFSIGMATVFTCAIMMYIFLSFMIMKKGNMSLYTLFLMSGGMTVPYVWGVAFLDEDLTLFRTLGLLLIIGAIVIFNSDVKKIDKKQVLLCVAVFFLNGISSVSSKLHQINPVSEIVTSSDFSFIVMVVKTVFSAVLMFVFRNKFKSEETAKLPIKAVIPVVILAAAADGFSYMLQLMGASNLPATVLYPLVTGGSVILSAIAGLVVYKEKLNLRQWLGIALCFAGTLLFL